MGILEGNLGDPGGEFGDPVMRFLMGNSPLDSPKILSGSSFPTSPPGPGAAPHDLSQSFFFPGRFFWEFFQTLPLHPRESFGKLPGRFFFFFPGAKKTFQLGRKKSLEMSFAADPEGISQPRNEIPGKFPRNEGFGIGGKKRGLGLGGKI